MKTIQLGYLFNLIAFIVNYFSRIIKSFLSFILIGFYQYLPFLLLFFCFVTSWIRRDWCRNPWIFLILFILVEIFATIHSCAKLLFRVKEFRNNRVESRFSLVNFGTFFQKITSNKKIFGKKNLFAQNIQHKICYRLSYCTKMYVENEPRYNFC